MRLTNNIGFMLQHLSFVLARQSDQILQEQLGIGFSQFKILMVLQWNPSIRQRQIADRLGQTEASISRQIGLLKEEGLLITQLNPKNRREHLTLPTTKGERLTDKAMDILNSYHAPMFDMLDEKQRERLLETLKIMHNYACGRSRAGGCVADKEIGG